MILHFYFARRFAKSFLALCFIFFCLIVLIDSVEQIRKFRNQTDVGLPELVQLTLLNVPQAMNEILPLVVISGDDIVVHQSGPQQRTGGDARGWAVCPQRPYGAGRRGVDHRGHDRHIAEPDRCGNDELLQFAGRRL